MLRPILTEGVTLGERRQGHQGDNRGKLQKTSKHQETPVATVGHKVYLGRTKRFLQGKGKEKSP